jgi:hypothetical protein
MGHSLGAVPWDSRKRDSTRAWAGHAGFLATRETGLARWDRWDKWDRRDTGQQGHWDTGDDPR